MAEQKGTTLVEILVVLVIVSILTAIAYPPLMRWYQGAAFRSEVSTLVSWLQRAKTEAVKTHAYVAIKAGTHGYLIFVDNSNVKKQSGDWVREVGERLLADYTLKKGYTLTTTFTKDRMRFSTRPGIKAGTFILKDLAGHSMKVIVSIIGRIRVE